MRFLTDLDSLAAHLTCARYTAARIKADEVVAPMATLVTDPRTDLKLKMAARNDALDELTDSQAVRDDRDRRLRDLLLDLGRRAHAHFGSRSHAGFLRILAKPPSTVASLPADERKKAVQAVVAALADKATPAELAGLGKPIAAAQKAVDAAQAALTAAELKVADCRRMEADAKTALQVGYRRLHAQLTDKFAADKSRVEGYFRSPAKATGSEGKVAKPVEPIVAGDQAAEKKGPEGGQG